MKSQIGKLRRVKIQTAGFVNVSKWDGAARYSLCA